MFTQEYRIDKSVQRTDSRLWCSGVVHLWTVCIDLRQDRHKESCCLARAYAETNIPQWVKGPFTHPTSTRVEMGWVSGCVGFNIPLDTLLVISETIFTGQMTKPTVSKHRRKPVGRQRSGLNPTRTTPPCYNNTTLDNRLYAQRNGPNVTNPICCSHKCAVDCEHRVTQSSTELFW